MKRIGVVFGVVVAGLLLAPLVVPIFIPWSPINCEHQEINIKTGQARYSRSLWFIIISVQTEDTPLSLALQGDTVDVANIKPWHRVHTFSPGLRHSPHYLFHSAFYHARHVETLNSIHEFTPEQQKEIATAILTSWQQSGRDDGANEVIHKLSFCGLKCTTFLRFKVHHFEAVGFQVV